MSSIPLFERLEMFDTPIKKGQRNGGRIKVLDDRGAVMSANVLRVDFASAPDLRFPDDRELVYTIDLASKLGVNIPDVLRSKEHPDRLVHSMRSLSRVEDQAVEPSGVVYRVGEAGVAGTVTITHHLPQ